jgi:hypothetical protein
VDIADIDAALGKVRVFIGCLELDRDNWYNEHVPVAHQQASAAAVQKQLPVIMRIAARADGDLTVMLKSVSAGWPYDRTLEAAQQLAGLLSSAEEIERILGPAGPKLAAAELHPWIWDAAVHLWDDGHYREAVQAAAQALFDSHLPAKLGVAPARSARDLLAQAFLTEPPTAANPRLRLADYPDSSATWTSQHEGARFFGMGCAQLIRNLATHDGMKPDEQVALEQLASLSLLARLVDRAKVVTI